MAFRFSLEAVLAYRKNLERQQELRLQAAHQEANRILQKIAELDRATEQLMESQSQELQRGTTSAELLFFLAGHAALQRRRQGLLQELANAQKRLALMQQEFVEARRSREVLERLRGRARAEYQIQNSRHEQREMDDLFLLRRAHRPNK